LKPGSLVLHKFKTGALYLTPLNYEKSEDIERWVEWRVGEFGLVLHSHDDQFGLLILVPDGVGFCFNDEVVRIDNSSN